MSLTGEFRRVASGRPRCAPPPEDCLSKGRDMPSPATDSADTGPYLAAGSYGRIINLPTGRGSLAPASRIFSGYSVTRT